MVHLTVTNLYGKALPCTKGLGFVACWVTSKVFGIGASESSLGDINTIKSGKRPDIKSDASDKHSIVYAYACIESEIIERLHYEKN